MKEFKDTTGRPGPATWELGSFPAGQEDFPVRGVSWYEANAFAAWAGKRLPTVHHWRQAAPPIIFSNILEYSNFNAKGAAKAGEYAGLGPYGTLDMAGNVREWCWNAVGDRRYNLGGAWNYAALSLPGLRRGQPVRPSADQRFPDHEAARRWHRRVW